ncbi:Arginine transport ATP-binding protein ArtM [Candidatus Nanosyncoccus alces]|uniref:Arginine transport ATP-binding protein ArtM n=1 Tax=Candidatus Nanosyncoccus alces TaxID=2171997 RepID=A0ABY0FNP1_9BACT|nr:amino acid ABC transporter ATP-binding protein [Candidatus Nanosyncoccus alces]RYC74643.1 Arginine transport ATP-binding protein ArtM [Candidatus Nanosyncoccus alces]
MEEKIIRIKNLKKEFGKNKVLRGIDFELNKGEKVVILGASGSGKSTFLRCINRMEEPTSGEIYFGDTLITDKNIQKMRQNIGMVFQHFNLINNLTVMQNLILAPVKLKLMDEETAEKRARGLLKHIGLLSKADAFPASLSGGQKQRVAIIRAMMMSPKVLLFDEPTSALDPESIGDVLSLIREVAEAGMTIMIVTHEMNFAKEIATRVIFLDQGKIIEEGKPREFFEQPKTPRVREFLEKVL